MVTIWKQACKLSLLIPLPGYSSTKCFLASTLCKPPITSNLYWPDKSAQNFVLSFSSSHSSARGGTLGPVRSSCSFNLRLSTKHSSTLLTQGHYNGPRKWQQNGGHKSTLNNNTVFTKKRNNEWVSCDLFLYFQHSFKV